MSFSAHHDEGKERVGGAMVYRGWYHAATKAKIRFLNLIFHSLSIGGRANPVRLIFDSQIEIIYWTNLWVCEVYDSLYLTE